MSDYLIPKLIFDPEKIKIGYFIEINNVTNPLEEPRRGVILAVRENAIEYMTGQRVVGRVITSEIEDQVLEIKVTKRLDTSAQFINEVIKHVEIENLPDRELRLVLDKRFSNPYARIQVNGMTFYPAIVDGISAKSDVRWYMDSSPERTGPKE